MNIFLIFSLLNFIAKVSHKNEMPDKQWRVRMTLILTHMQSNHISFNPVQFLPWGAINSVN